MRFDLCVSSRGEGKANLYLEFRFRVRLRQIKLRARSVAPVSKPAPAKLHSPISKLPYFIASKTGQDRNSMATIKMVCSADKDPMHRKKNIFIVYRSSISNAIVQSRIALSNKITRNTTSIV